MELLCACNMRIQIAMFNTIYFRKYPDLSYSKFAVSEYSLVINHSFPILLSYSTFQHLSLGDSFLSQETDKISLFKD